MNELSAVSVEELDHVQGGFGLLPAIGAFIFAGDSIKDLEEPGEPLPGFNDFLSETQRISRL